MNLLLLSQLLFKYLLPNPICLIPRVVWIFTTACNLFMTLSYIFSRIIVIISHSSSIIVMRLIIRCVGVWTMDLCEIVNELLLLFLDLLLLFELLASLFYHFLLLILMLLLNLVAIIICLRLIVLLWNSWG